MRCVRDDQVYTLINRSQSYSPFLIRSHKFQLRDSITVKPTPEKPP